MVKDSIDVDKLSDAELRTELLKFGFPVMPITGTTRKVMTKKLKLLMDNKSKVTAESGRRSLGKYSSEEESDNEVKSAKKDKRRVTMAAPTFTKTVRKTIIEPEPIPPSPPKKRDARNATVTTTTTTTRSSRILKQVPDDFDTGSDSESDIMVSSNNLEQENDMEYTRRSPVRPSILSSSFGSRYSPPKIPEPIITPDRHTFANPSPTRHTTFGSPSVASDYAADRLNQIRNRLSLGSPGYDRPSSYGASSIVTQEQEEVAETPFLSNFTRRLSALSSGKKPASNSRSDSVKEHDTNGTARSYLSSFRATRGREPLYSAQKLNGKNNYISMAVLAGAGLFFLFLAVVYLGLRSDTSMISGGFIKPVCIPGDHQNKKGVNCISEDDATQAVNLLNVIRPELIKRSVAHKCFDGKIKPHMTENEIVTFCQSNFGIRDPTVIRIDLKNLEVMVFVNPEWGVSVVQTHSNDGVVFEENIAKNMEQVIFNRDSKITSLVVFNPELPWKCTFYQSLTSVLRTVLGIGAIFVTLYLTNMGVKYYRRVQHKSQEEVTFLVEKILEIMQNAAEESGESFLVINHVRDMILSVKERKDKKQSWDKAVQYINENESRIRTEVQTVQGESFEVWRWIGSNLNRSGSPSNKSWQGQAFETQTGAVNSLPCSPTPCLKIRGMIEEGDTSVNARAARDAVLSKCAHRCRLLHCQPEPATGCVYLKCADPQEAAVAYTNLHGWWYDGHLVTVKYLRLERYMQRFPESPLDGPPFLKSATPSID